MNTFPGRSLTILLLLGLSYGLASAQFISADTYTRYELLPPDTHQFKIYYEVTETQVIIVGVRHAARDPGSAP